MLHIHSITLIKFVLYTNAVVHTGIMKALSRSGCRRAPVRHTAISHIMSLRDDDEIDGYLDLLEALPAQFNRDTLPGVSGSKSF